MTVEETYNDFLEFVNDKSQNTDDNFWKYKDKCFSLYQSHVINQHNKHMLQLIVEKK